MYDMIRTEWFVWETSYVKKSNQNTNKQSATCWALYIPEPTDRKILFWVPSSISRPHLGNDNDTQLIDNFTHIFPSIFRSENHWFTSFFDWHHLHHRSAQTGQPSEQPPKSAGKFLCFNFNNKHLVRNEFLNFKSNWENSRRNCDV